MTFRSSRRQFVRGSAVGAAWLASSPALGRTRTAALPSIDEVADLLVETPRKELHGRLEPLLRKGLAWNDLHAATFVAGIREVRPRPVGNKLHAVLAIESTAQVMDVARREPALRSVVPQVVPLAVLWTVADVARAQERDARQGDWHMCEAQGDPFETVEAAEAELVNCFRARDEKGVSLAVTSLVRRGGRVAAREALWPLGMREHVGLCHRTLFAVHADRSLERFGDAWTEPTMRSVAYGLMEAPPGETIEHHGASVELAKTLREDWRTGEGSPRRSLAFARELRELDPAGARKRAVELINDGLHPESLWDALRLAAADHFARGSGLLQVHSTTVTNALAHVARTSQRDSTRRLATLMAATWMPMFRDRFVRSRSMPMDAPGLDGVLEQKTPDASELVARHVSNLYRGADEAHQPKYAGSIVEDVARADPRWSAALLAPGRGYLPGPDDAPTEDFERATELLARLD